MQNGWTAPRTLRRYDSARSARSARSQIAARLYLSEASVKGYVSRMLDKLGCANRAQAGLLAHDAPVSGLTLVGEAAGWFCAVPGRPGCVLRPDVRVPAGAGGPHGPAASLRLLRSCR